MMAKIDKLKFLDSKKKGIDSNVNKAFNSSLIEHYSSEND